MGPLYDSLRSANECAQALGDGETGAETMPPDSIVVIVVAAAQQQLQLPLPGTDADAAVAADRYATDVDCVYYCVSDWPAPAAAAVMC